MRKVIKVANIDCAMCATAIETHFNKEDSIHATVNVPNKKVIFDYDEPWNTDLIVDNLRKIGYRPILTNKEAEKSKRIDLIDMIVAILLTLPLLYTMFAHLGLPNIVPTIFLNGWFQLPFATITLFFCGRRFFISAFNQLKNKNLGMDTLVVIGTLSAYIYSVYLLINHQMMPNHDAHPHYYFEATAMITAMVMIGNFIENRVREKTTDTLAELVSLESKEAVKLVEKKEVPLPIDEIVIGDKIIVKANEMIPIDGIIVEGNTYIDEQTMTGESMPRNKTVNNQVYAATTNLTQTIIVKVTANASETELAKIIKTVEDTAKIKPKAQRVADKIANFFVPGVVLIAVITLLIWLFTSNFNVDSAISAFVSVLVISCPCALGLATPTSISASSGVAFKNGILFKGGEFFEITPRITTICFDKTGTLTKGEPSVTDYYGDIKYLRLTASLEKHSNHPLSKAILQYYNDANFVEITDFSVETGFGLKGLYEKKEIIIGSKKVLDMLNIEIPFPEYEELLKQGKTVFFTIYHNEVLNMIAVKDEIKDDTKAIINELKKRNIRTCLLTGDNYLVADALARELRIDAVYAELLPNDKANIIKSFQENNEIVAFVGDGVNDSPALKIASVSFSVKNANDIAISAADVSLMNSDLSSVIKAMDLSKKTLINIYQNFFWAFIYNIVMIPLAATGILNPMLSGIGMAFSSIMVVLNALRLKRVKFTNYKEE